MKISTIILTAALFLSGSTLSLAQGSYGTNNNYDYLGNSYNSPYTNNANPNSVDVRGYTRKDGTYVQPHKRSSPNSTTYDNWSTRGNINPYTGKMGTKNPY